MMRLAGATLTLRPPVAADAAALFTLGRDPEVTRWFSWGPYETVAQPAAFIAEQVGRRERGEALVLVIEHIEHGLVGVTELTEWGRRDRRAVIGTWLRQASWGTGVNAESKRMVLGLAFEHCGLERVGAYSDVANVRSQRALERAGFTREGTLRAWHRHGEVQKDVVLFGVTRADWEAMPGATMTLSGELPAAFRPQG